MADKVYSVHVLATTLHGLLFHLPVNNKAVKLPGNPGVMPKCTLYFQDF